MKYTYAIILNNATVALFDADPEFASTILELINKHRPDDLKCHLEVIEDYQPEESEPNDI